jgi:hypothetical protein
MKACSTRRNAAIVVSALMASCTTATPEAQKKPSPEAAVQTLCASLVPGRPLASLTLASGEKFELPASGDFFVLPQTTGAHCVCSLLLKETILVEKRLTNCSPPR